MAKKEVAKIKLQIPAGAANPSPPVGPALGQHGLNNMGFCKEFNARTQDQKGMIIPVVITVYADRSFTFITKTPPAAVLIHLYIPKSESLERQARNRRIRTLFNGKNSRALATQFYLSQRQIHKILQQREA